MCIEHQELASQYSEKELSKMDEWLDIVLIRSVNGTPLLKIGEITEQAMQRESQSLRDVECEVKTKKRKRDDTSKDEMEGESEEGPLVGDDEAPNKWLNEKRHKVKGKGKGSGDRNGDGDVNDNKKSLKGAKPWMTGTKRVAIAKQASAKSMCKRKVLSSKYIDDEEVEDETSDISGPKVNGML